MIQGKKGIKTRNKKRKITKKFKRNIIILVIIIIFLNLNSSKKNTDMKLVLNYDDITESLSHELIRIDSVIYMSVDDIARYIDANVYQENDLIITTSDFKVACLKLDSNVLDINGSEQVISGNVIKVNDIVYIPISEMEKVYNIEFKYSKSSNISTVETLNTNRITAIAKKKISIKKEKNFFSKTVSKVKKGESLVWISEEDKWTKVMDNDGNIGYVNTDKLIDVKTEREEFSLEQMSQNTVSSNSMEEDITNQNLDTFDNRKELIEKIFTKAIENEKNYVKLIIGNENKNIERLKIEAAPIFNECGITIDFLN